MACLFLGSFFWLMTHSLQKYLAFVYIFQKKKGTASPTKVWNVLRGGGSSTRPAPLDHLFPAPALPRIDSFPWSLLGSDNPFTD